MTLLGDLRDIVGATHVLDSKDTRAGYERDWTGRFGGDALAVVRPADTAQTAAVVAAAAERGAAVVPQGGNTGLVGGGVPRGGEIVVSLTRLTKLRAIDGAPDHVAAGAGVTLAQLQAHAHAAGFDAGMDFAARDSATVGGLVACDAGGMRALRHGTARARVRGVEAVLPDGSIMRRMAGLAKDNAGLALPALFVGSEGTLGIITEVVWSCVTHLPQRVCALVGVADPDAAAALLAHLRAVAPSLESCELITDTAMEIALRHTRSERLPVERAPLYVLTELAAAHDPLDELAAALEQAGIADAVVGDDAHSRARLWRLREALPEAVTSAGDVHKLDVGVPLTGLTRFLGELPANVEAAVPGSQVVVWGHLGDGNLHVNLLGPPPTDGRADDAVLELVLACGGTISAEHGVGVAKSHWLEVARGASDFAAMRAIKGALDPHGVMNPGVMLPGLTSRA